MVLRCAWLTVILINLVLPSSAGAQDDLPLKVDRLSEKVLTISSMTGNSRVLALATQKGLVMIESLWSQGIAREVREIVSREFGRNDFAYLILTGDREMATGGAMAFSDVPIISHVLCRDSLAERRGRLNELLTDRAAEFRGRVERTTNALKDMDPESKEAEFDRQWVTFCRRVAEDLSAGYQIELPTIVFNDRLSLDMGDLTLEIIYFGPASNEGELFVLVREEGLVWLGDVFHAGHLLPRKAQSALPDLPRWLSVFDYILSDKEDIKHVVRANSQVTWTPERLRAQRDFIQEINEKVISADAQGLSLEQTLESLTIDRAFPYTKEWEDYSEILDNDLRGIIAWIWRTMNDSAAGETERVLRTEGTSAAINRFHQIKSSSDFYLFESEFNSLGYKLLGEERIDDALAVFKLVVETWPDSWNAYDSLAEACLNNGQEELAKEYYLKSLELNPENENAKTILKQLEEK